MVRFDTELILQVKVMDRKEAVELFTVLPLLAYMGVS